MHIQSINIAQTKELSTAEGIQITGIVKSSVSGPIKIHKLGLEGDFIANKTFHGGEDQAVYLYSAEDYQWWSETLGIALAPGTFGENLTLTNFDSRQCRIGDRLQIGELLLEISAPRTPCATLAARMGDPGFVKTFFNAQRPGAYARVLKEGFVTVGDAAIWNRTTENFVKTLDVFIIWNKKMKSPEIITKALNSPIAMIHKAKLMQWHSAIKNTD